MKFFLKLVWSGDPLQPYILISDEEGSIEKSLLEFGSPFNLRILETGFCIGTEPEKGKWISCIENKKRVGQDAQLPNLAIQGKQCALCIKEEYFACRKTCTGKYCTPSSQMAYNLCQPAETAVYLTRIGSKNKVGVSLNPLRRWVEQGSDFATWIVKLPGLEARAVEQEVAKSFSFNLQIGSKQKMSEAHTKPTPDSIEELNQAIYAIQQIAEEIAGQRNKPLQKNQDADFIDLHNYYGDLKRINRPLQEIDIKEGVEFGGTLVAVKGAIIILEKDSYYYGVNAKKLSGCSFEFITNAKMETQLSLDDWF
ncbi:MAG: DUF2797 domain-containing protein [Methanobacteriota archaeon]|nr:MAG: DUF2797 domain-containing protein [Euryarchaeota archaeon]